MDNTEEPKLDFEKQKAKELLDELNGIRSPGPTMNNWNIKARALLVFAACKIHCSKPSAKAKR